MHDEDHEVIADSEGEDNLALENSDIYAGENAVSHIHNIRGPSNVSESLLPILGKSKAATSTKESTPLGSPSKPRPKPRPLYKKDQTNMKLPISHVMQMGTASVNMDFTSSNIADRAKLRSRNMKPHVSDVPLSDIIELSSDNDDMNLLPPSTVRPKNKKASKPKVGRRKKIIPDDDPSQKPVPKSNKRNKALHPTSPGAVLASQGTTPPPSSSSAPQFPLPIPFRLFPSQLPPSDPPASTAMTFNYPPIETLPNIETELTTFSSPYTSLFSSPATGKRKRAHPSSFVDELYSDKITGASNGDIQTILYPPLPGTPSTFFAESSPPPMVFTGPVANITKKEKYTEPLMATKKLPEADTCDTGLVAKNGQPKRPANSKAKKSLQHKTKVVQPPKGKGKGKDGEVFKGGDITDKDEDEIVKAVVKKTVAVRRRNSLTSLSSLEDSEPEITGSPDQKRKPINQAQEPAEADEGKGKQVITSDGHVENVVGTSKAITARGKGKVGKAVKAKKNTKGDLNNGGGHAEPTIVEEHKTAITLKENMQPSSLQTPAVPEPDVNLAELIFPSLSSRYTIAPKTKAVPMSDLIRRVNSLPGSPFHSPVTRISSSSRLSSTGTAYSPYLKSSRSTLSRIAPLHPNRRPPPPPLPPPPPRKKTKKELEREEKWEEELVESAGGIIEWAAMTDAERAGLRRAKREKEMTGWDD